MSDSIIEYNLNDTHFSGMSWARAADYLRGAKDQRNYMGLKALQSDLVWRFYKK